MLTVPFVTIGPDTTGEELLAAASVLHDAGVDGVGFLDAADLGAAVSAVDSCTMATLAALALPGLAVIGSQSAVFGYPYQTARRLATLDHLSGGHSGWLLRATSTGPEGTGHEWRSAGVVEHELARAGEHAEIGYRLWDSWEDGAQWPDKESGNFKDDSRIHPIDYRSDAFQVDGPLDVPPSPQRRPVVIAFVRTPTEVAALAPWLDVAVVDTGPETIAELVAAVRADGRVPRVIVATREPHPTSAALEGLVDDVDADGVAPVTSPAAAGDVAASVSPSGSAGATFAARLGLGTLPVGGRTA